jgi:peptidoglycan/LPS O-acetylase OafA/YrhL
MKFQTLSIVANKYMPDFVIHYGGQNQINHQEASLSLLVISALLVSVILLSLRKRNNTKDNSFLNPYTSETLRGIAVIGLFYVHLAYICIEGESFWEQSGRWVIYVFLYISAVALTKSYGVDFALGGSFWVKRLRRLLLPTWITLVMFYCLDYIFFGITYPFGKILANFLGIITPSHPNGPAWYITFILFQYLVFFVISYVKMGKTTKFLIMLIVCYLSSLCIWKNSYLLECFASWPKYIIVFPLSVFICSFHDKVKKWLETLWEKPLLYLFVLFLFSYQYFTGRGIDRLSHLLSSWTYTELIQTLTPISLVVSLVMITFALDRTQIYSVVLEWLGKHSFEIFLVHFPFMAYYDFFLFRKPLFVFILFYVLLIMGLSCVLKIVTSRLNKLVFVNPD